MQEHVQNESSQLAVLGSKCTTFFSRSFHFQPERERTVPARQEPQFSDGGTTALAQGVSDIHAGILRVHRLWLALAGIGCSKNTVWQRAAACDWHAPLAKARSHETGNSSHRSVQPGRTPLTSQTRTLSIDSIDQTCPSECGHAGCSLIQHWLYASCTTTATEEALSAVPSKAALQPPEYRSTTAQPLFAMDLARAESAVDRPKAKNGGVC